MERKIFVYDPNKAPMRDVQTGLALIQKSCAIAKPQLVQRATLCGVHWSMVPHNTTSNYYRKAKQLRYPHKTPYNIYIENPYIRKSGYFSISVNKANNLNCLKEGYENNDSRRNLFEVQLKEIAPKGKNILVIGQALRNNKDTTTFSNLQTNQNIYVNTPGVPFYKDLIKFIMSLTKRPIVFRPRSGHSLWDGMRGVSLSPNQLISQDLKDAFVAINLTSRASIDALIEGIPVISLSSYDSIWELSEHSLLNIENPKMFTEDERQKLLNKASWLQWTRPEFIAAKPFKHLKIYEELKK